MTRQIGTFRGSGSAATAIFRPARQVRKGHSTVEVAAPVRCVISGRLSGNEIRRAVAGERLAALRVVMAEVHWAGCDGAALNCFAGRGVSKAGCPGAKIVGTTRRRT